MQLHARLQHQNVITLFGAFQQDNQVRCHAHAHAHVMRAHVCGCGVRAGSQPAADGTHATTLHESCSMNDARGQNVLAHFLHVLAGGSLVFGELVLMLHGYSALVLQVVLVQEFADGGDLFTLLHR